MQFELSDEEMRFLDEQLEHSLAGLEATRDTAIEDRMLDMHQLLEVDGELVTDIGTCNGLLARLQRERDVRGLGR